VLQGIGRHRISRAKIHISDCVLPVELVCNLIEVAPNL